MKYTYTIIIPHKNIPKLLQRCLDSIPKREDTHIIVVDDNSDPNIVNFCQFPGYNRDDVEIIFSKEGKGAGYARNVGLEHANSEKILFADSDDFFNYCIRDILDEYQNDNSDVVFFNVSAVNNDTYTKSGRGSDINKYHLLYEKKTESALFLFRYDMGNPIAKMFKKSFLDTYRLKFDETRIHDDTSFSYLAGYYGRKFSVDKRALYCITYRPNSISFTLDDQKILTRMQVLGKRDRFFIDHGIDLDQIKVNLHIDSLVSLRKKNQKELYNKCIQILVDNGLRKRDIYKRMFISIKNNVVKRIRRRLLIIIESRF